MDELAEGSGIIDKLTDWLLERPPKALKSFLKQNGDRQIYKLQIHRRPVPKAIQTIGRLVSKGLRVGMDRAKYDNLFHLYMTTVIDGKIWLIEKNQRVNIAVLKSMPSDKGQSTIRVHLKEGQRITWNELFERAVKDGLKWRYRAETNNCQDFLYRLMDVLKAHNAATKKFILQPVEKLLQSDTIVKSILSRLTDAGGVIDLVKKGGGDVQPIPEKFILRRMNN